jgi:glutamyl-tRNA reductase
MNRLEVRFTTFRDSTADRRARLAEDLRLRRAREAVLIDTCHRVEFISVDADQGTPPAQARGAEAVRRVFEVVGGFDSAILAEEQMLGQVRMAYDEALASGRSGPILNELMQRALRFGRRVRSHARPGTDRSLADLAVRWLRERVEVDARVVVAGTGEMGRLVAARLSDAGHPITLVSQSAERGGRALESLSRKDHRLAVGRLTQHLLRGAPGIALAVRASEPALTADLLSSGTEPWVVDLSSPSAVDAAARDRLGERLIDIDRLDERHVARPVLTARAEARLRRELDGEVEAFVAWFEGRRSVDAVALLRREAETVRRRHLDRLRRRTSLDEDQLAAVEASSAAMVNELLHGPIVELRHGGADAATVRRIFRMEA